MTEDESVNGAKIAAQILNAMDPANKEKIVKNIEESVPELAVKISESLFSFDDISTLPEKSIQTLAQAVNHHDLVYALKLASEETKEAFYKNVSERKRVLLKDDGTNSGSVKESEVQSAQKRILKTLDELQKEGKAQTPEASEGTSGTLKDVWV